MACAQHELRSLAQFELGCTLDPNDWLSTSTESTTELPERYGISRKLMSLRVSTIHLLWDSSLQHRAHNTRVSSIADSYSEVMSSAEADRLSQKGKPIDTFIVPAGLSPGGEFYLYWKSSTIGFSSLYTNPVTKISNSGNYQIVLVHVTCHKVFRVLTSARERK